MFVSTNGLLTGKSLFTFLQRLFGDVVFGKRSPQSESGAWKAICQAANKQKCKYSLPSISFRPALEKNNPSYPCMHVLYNHIALPGSLSIQREQMKQPYIVRMPRCGPENAIKEVYGTFLVGIVLRDPASDGFDGELHKTLSECLGMELLPLDVYNQVKEEYVLLWQSHEPRPLNRYLHLRGKRERGQSNIKVRGLQEIGTSKVVCTGCKCPCHTYIQEKGTEGTLHLKMVAEEEGSESTRGEMDIVKM